MKRLIGVISEISKQKRKRYKDEGKSKTGCLKTIGDERIRKLRQKSFQGQPHLIVRLLGKEC